MGRTFKKNFIGGKTGFVKRTICEVLREIYWKIEDSEAREKIEEAMGMTKKMDAKLREYRKRYDDEWWEDVDNPEKIFQERKDQHEEESE